MSADDSAKFDDVAERTLLLGQHMPASSVTAPNAVVAFDRKSDFASARLALVLSQCQTDCEIDRELWDDFEIHRRSANTYINQYLDCLQTVQEERPRDIREIDISDDEAPSTGVGLRGPGSSAMGVTRAEWRLKISHDSLVRDLLAMDETLEFFKARAISSPSSGPSYISRLSILDTMSSWPPWQTSYRGMSLGGFASSIAGLACYCPYNIWKWVRAVLVEHRKQKIEDLLRRLKKGDLDERNRSNLDGVSLRMLYWFRK